MKIYIWGTGEWAGDYVNSGEIRPEDICGFIQTSKGDVPIYNNKYIFSPQELFGKEYDYILVCVDRYGKEILDIAKSSGLETDKMYFMDNSTYSTDLEISKSGGIYVCKKLSDNEKIKDIFPLFYAEAHEKSYREYRSIITLSNGSDQIKDSILYLNYSSSIKCSHKSQFKDVLL